MIRLIYFSKIVSEFGLLDRLFICKSKYDYKIWFILIPVCFIIISCRTNTIYDSLIYPSEATMTQNRDNLDVLELCQALENEGYVFDEFHLSEYGTEVTYSGNDVVDYVQSSSLVPTIIISINRDYDNPSIFTNEESRRLERTAQEFCHSYYQVSSDLAIEYSLSGVIFWDYVNGVRGGYTLTETCNIDNSYYWSTGSYANQYTQDSEYVCPSGRVQY